MAKYSYHRLDGNHAEIRAALEAVGATVNEKGPLDLLVGFRGANYLLEVKTARGQLRASQKSFLDRWRGQAHIVRTVEDAFGVIGITKREMQQLASLMNSFESSVAPGRPKG